MQVSDVGEARLIETLAEIVSAGSDARVARLDSMGFRLLLPIGDDAAAWDDPGGQRVFTTDTLVEGSHFSLGRTGWEDLGWKAMAVNLSDVAAMGCAPLYLVISLGLQGDQPVEGLADMYRGMLEACQKSGGTIVGGDVVRSPVFFVSIAVVGAKPDAKWGGSVEGSILTRSAARPGDMVAVTGSLGCSGGGLQMLLKGLAFDEATSAHLKSAHNRPVPRVPQGMMLARHGVVAAIDVSDGLVDDLGKLCKASGVGALVHSDRVPADEYLRRAYPDDWLQLALTAGEDYELLFTAPPGVMDEVKLRADVPVSVIGEITQEPRGVTVLDSSGDAVIVERGGWDHFSQ